MQLIAVTREQFATKAWRRPTSYSFAAQSNPLPVTVAELARLVPTMPLGFVKAEDSFRLVAITSLQPGTNCFVAPDGNWIGDYIPAVIRAYPFQLVKPLDRDDPVLCFDTDSGLLGDAEQGEAFFDDDGPSPAIKQVLTLLSEIEEGRVVTQRLVDALQAAELIQPWPLSIKQGEQTFPVEGLYRIDENALNALPDEAFLPLRKTGALPLAYAHLFSMNQLGMLSKAAELQGKIKEQLKVKAANQLSSFADLGFKLPADGTIKFS